MKGRLAPEEIQKKEEVEECPIEEHRPDKTLWWEQEVKDTHQDEKAQDERDILHPQVETGVGMSME